MSDPLTDDHLGPVEYVAVEFPRGHVTVEGFDHLLAQVDAGNVLVLDLELVRRGPDGWHKVSAADLGTDVDLSTFEGADSSLLDDADFELLAAGLAEDSILAVLVYEDLTMHAALRAWGAGGARLVAQGPLGVDDLTDALADDDLAHHG